ncbi:MAG: non-ribosomal peptide synthetase, partial [Myxococcales bacterium]|nr:non-ribosomal peptide synthetase [Myxococcales bacterium]
RWSQRLGEHVRAGGLDGEIEYWQAHGASEPLPVDHDLGAATEATTRTVSVTLPTHETRLLLHESGRAYRTQGHELLVAALAKTLGEWSGRDAVSVRLEGHGREDLVEGLDVSRTVGWLTSMYPVHLDGGGDLRDLIRATKERLRTIPNKGVGYGLLRYLHPDAALRGRLAASQSEVVFNYLGQLDTMLGDDALFAIAREPAGPVHSPRARREARLEINAVVMEGQLHVSFSYSDRHYRPETIEKLAAGYADAVRAIVAHCTSDGAGGYTPSDFALARLDQPTLDGWLGNRRDIEAVYPLAPMQEGMLFHTLLEPESAVYFEQMSCVLVGLDLDAFEKAWQQTVARHAVLRTSFWWEGLPKPLQCVHNQVDITVERHAAIDLEADRARGFTLDRAPLMRLQAAPLDGERTQFVWSFHHLLLDGWSTSLVIRDVFEHYQANVEGRAPRLSPAGSHEAYVRWLAEQDRDAATQFWKETLRGFTAPTPLGARPATGEVREERVELSAAASDALRQLARRNAVTLNNVVQAAWGLLIARYSGEADVVFGVTVAGRPAELPLVESSVGLFINSVPMRLQLDLTAPVAQCIKQAHLQQGALQAYEWTPLSEIQGASDVGRATPLFESLLVYESYPVDASLAQSSSALGVEGIVTYEQTNYPLTVCIVPGATLSIRMTHRDGSFEAGAVARMAHHLATLLAAIAAQPDAPVSELTLLTAPEERQLLVEWNDTAVDHPLDGTMRELFEARVAKSGAATAVREAGRTLSYEQLDARAAEVARALTARGIGEESIVALRLPRGIDLVTAILGVFKAGAAYLPLDPDHPERRQEEVVDDSGAALVIDSIDALLADAAEPSRDRGAVQPSSLAYVIYTSGSTGKPKGAMVEQRGMLNHLFAKVDDLGLTSYDVVAQTAPACFDISVWQMLAPLAVGGCIDVFGDETVRDPLAILDEVEGRGISILEIVPSMLRAILDEVELRPAPPALPSLRWMIATGEALPGDLCARWMASFPGVPLLNAYGPTECSDDVTHHRVEPGDGSDGPVPIGRPIANTQLYVLDAQLQPVARGVPGDLYVGGVGVGRGYVGDPSRTASVFLPDPFASGRPGARLYRTGDRARHRADGALEFLGRKDGQVKVRGHRIELGEIESRLRALPEVRDAALAVRGGHGGEAQLVAYVVLHDPGAGTATLRAQLEAELPKYMVPSAFVRLEALPLTPNGKVDKKALPAPDGGLAELAERYLAPRTPTEERLAAIWGELLGLERVGVHDDFFEIGGHSLLATRTVSRIRTSFSVQLALKTLFEASTVAALAGEIDRATTAGAFATERILPALEAGDRPVSAAQAALYRQAEEGASLRLIPARLRLRQGVDVETLAEAICQLAAEHDALGVTFCRRGAAVVARPNAEVAPAISAGDREDRLAEQLARPFNLESTPPFRVVVTRTSAGESVLSLIVHPIAGGPALQAAVAARLGQLLGAETLAAARAETVPDLLQQMRADRSTAAIVEAGGKVSFQELDERANQLAHQLRALGVATETRVGICLPRSADLVVAMLGVLKAGGAYVPLDPSLPRERIRLIAADAGVQLVVTAVRAAAVLPAGVQPLLLDATPALASQPRFAPDVELRGEQAAYVLYTSGSTGAPKGVVVPHRAL